MTHEHHAHDHHEEERHHHSHHRHGGSHARELLAGAAAFAAFRAFESRQRAQGKPVSHALAKELLAALAAAEVEKLIETKGRDKWDEWSDKNKLEDQVKARSRELYREKYEGRPHEPLTIEGGRERGRSHTPRHSSGHVDDEVEYDYEGEEEEERRHHRRRQYHH
ncbi:hypothetical protein ABW21_db0202702 [Orbilia brochopaga]|nr:hypothetical protein ABW21_db0202702 [Drechslerella brochopaga]